MSKIELRLLPSQEIIECDRDEILYAQTAGQYVKVCVMYKNKPVWATRHVSMRSFKLIFHDDVMFELNFYCIVKITAFEDYREKKLVLKQWGELTPKHKVSDAKIAHLRDKAGQ